MFSYGDAAFYGSLGGPHLNQPVDGIAATPDGGGFWLVASGGGVFAFGDVGFYGSMSGQPQDRQVVAIATVADGHGTGRRRLWGFAFGDGRH